MSPRRATAAAARCGVRTWGPASPRVASPSRNSCGLKNWEGFLWSAQRRNTSLEDSSSSAATRSENVTRPNTSVAMTTKTKRLLTGDGWLSEEHWPSACAASDEHPEDEHCCCGPSSHSAPLSGRLTEPRPTPRGPDTLPSDERVVEGDDGIRLEPTGASKPSEGSEATDCLPETSGSVAWPQRYAQRRFP